METPQSLPFQVLIIEDTVEMGAMMLAALKRVGIASYHATTGEDALAYLKVYRPDLILLDLSLPGMSGWDVLKQAKESYGEHTMPVIVTSAYSDHANRIIGKLQYVSRYLVKPFTAQDLTSAVSEVLELHKVGV